MRVCFGYAAVFALALLLAGCGSSEPDVSDKPLASRLGDSIDISLSELLGKPRSELAEMADEYTTKIHLQDESRRNGLLHMTLLDKFRLPLVVPVCAACPTKVRAIIMARPPSRRPARSSV